MNDKGVYAIVNLITGKFYIGSTLSSFRIRMNGHFSCLQRNVHRNRHLQNAYNKYGRHNLKFCILEKCKNDEIIEMEQWWMDMTLCTNINIGYNINRKAENSSGTKRSSEFKEACRKRWTGVKQSKEMIEKRMRQLRIPILQYDLNGNFIKKWSSTYEIQ